MPNQENQDIELDCSFDCGNYMAKNEDGVINFCRYKCCQLEVGNFKHNPTICKERGWFKPREREESRK